MTPDEMKNAVLQAAAGGRLSCEKAHDLSRDLGVSLQEIGKACDELKIKVSACQLGCF